LIKKYKKGNKYRIDIYYYNNSMFRLMSYPTLSA